VLSQEYEGDDEAGGDALAISKTAVSSGDRVLLIDDLIATGGTLIAGIDLVKGQGVSGAEGARWQCSNSSIG
jgi:adenine phosphoribosyltransferase